MTNTIESKVIASAAGSGLGGAVGTFVLWLLGVGVWHASNSASAAAQAVSAVPAPVSELTVVLLAVGGAFLAGYVAPHTSRVPGAHSADSATSGSTVADLIASAPASPPGPVTLQDPLPTLTADSLLNLQAATTPATVPEPAAAS